MRKSNLFFLYLVINLFLLLGIWFHSSWRWEAARPWLDQKREMIQRLELTDLCLFTEASYTRHPTQADGHVPFQDHPVSLEHFPSGSLFMPPPLLNKTHVRLDR